MATHRRPDFMKNALLILMAAATVALAAENKDTKATASWIDKITVAPVGALKTADLDGPSQWGAGFLAGYSVNPFVTVQVRALSFEGAGQSTTETKTKRGFGTVTTGEDEWGGRLVDELAILVPAKINRFSTESISLYVVPGAQWDLNTDNYGISAGLQLEYAFNKHISLGAGYAVRTWFHKPTSVDSLVSGQLKLSF